MLVYCWLVAVGCSLLGSHAQRNEKKKIDILLVKIKLASRSSVLLISCELSNLTVDPFPYIPVSLLTGVRGLKGLKKGREGWKKEEQSCK